MSTETKSETKSEPVPNSEESCGSYLKRWQSWNEKDEVWVACDRVSHEKAIASATVGKHYFFVNHRFEKPSTRTPKLVLSSFTKTLTTFLRFHVGTPFFDDDPECNIEDFFPKLKKMRVRFEVVCQTLKSGDKEDDAKLTFAKSVGYVASGKDAGGEETSITYMETLAAELPILLEVLEEKFKPIGDRFVVQSACGPLEYDLLRYYFEEGKQFTTLDEWGRQIAFVVDSNDYYDRWDGMYFEIEAHGYEWNGTAYCRYNLSRRIDKFEGNKEVQSLGFSVLTDEARDQLTARGRTYTTYSGVFYRTYNGKRVIIDRQGWGNKEGYTRDPDQKIPECPQDKLHLLKSYVCGFDLRSKRWHPVIRRCNPIPPFFLEDIQPVTFDEHAWEHLVLDSDTKLLIHALVEVTQNSNTYKGIINDVISGKGGGLLSVLHGPPGTGKTLTAEAVAEHLRRPLYMVGSSELSTEPEEMESNLKSILSLATAWDAVLLIDEADVFLEQRSLHELKRNALVSVALRLLEYHRGVLFLTTNRIQTFDEAFLSRFSIAIKYPELDQAARCAIWRKFFELAGATFQTSGRSSPGEEIVKVESPDSHSMNTEALNELAAKPFNGRTIKNLVRTAQALAMSSNEKLTIDHVNIVVRVQEKFLRDFGQMS